MPLYNKILEMGKKWSDLFSKKYIQLINICSVLKTFFKHIRINSQLSG